MREKMEGRKVLIISRVGLLAETRGVPPPRRTGTETKTSCPRPRVPVRGQGDGDGNKTGANFCKAFFNRKFTKFLRFL